MEKCQRCSKNTITLQCFHCPTINKICSLCDKIIHSRSFKINHNRVPIENVTLNLKDNSFENKEELNNKMIYIEDNKLEESKENNFKNNIKNYSTIPKNNNSSLIMENINNNIYYANANTNDISTLNQSKNMNDKTIENNSQKYSNTRFYLLKNKCKSLKNVHQISFSKNNDENINSFICINITQ